MSIALAFASVLGRVGYVIFSNAYTVSDSYNYYSVTVAVSTPQLYYTDGSRITNNVKSYKAVIRPVTADLAEVNKHFSKKEASKITAELSKGYPVVRSINTNDTKLKTFKVYDTDTTLSQLISDKSSGFLSYANLKPSKLKVSYLVDAKGRILAGDEGREESLGYYSREGYILTIDKDVQEAASKAAENLKSGCVIVMDAKTASILACVNKPDDTFINKAFTNYSVGSVFKIVVAACALENDVDINYDCTGSITVGDTTYTCQKEHKHGYQNLNTALANSCNCYFVNLALTLGGDKLLDTANALGFSSEICLFDNWNITSSRLPSKTELNSKGELALMGFGQGKLVSTPLQICSALCTISNSGEKNTPFLVKAKKEVNGSITEFKSSQGKRVISKKTADTLLDYLHNVVKNGTAKNAQTKSDKSAGKTATAQTGQFIDGRELYNTWFAGVYPYDNPEYCIVVMCQDGTSGAADCCPVFRTVVEKLEKR